MCYCSLVTILNPQSTQDNKADKLKCMHVHSYYVPAILLLVCIICRKAGWLVFLTLTARPGCFIIVEFIDQINYLTPTTKAIFHTMLVMYVYII